MVNVLPVRMGHHQMVLKLLAQVVQQHKSYKVGNVKILQRRVRFQILPKLVVIIVLQVS